ncbi:hypothetical protein E2562_003621 [Oryza meyeriana var. granulata]|uniref:Uncharacterized protein n=1 Tax=Oryza meyeriana var. granulata TaxID=110450 RepID=A0A6G1CNP0_9ORYZ|nr:hypothetical protein E2562_003621 [Oryza meyeriana var. granulata]
MPAVRPSSEELAGFHGAIGCGLQPAEIDDRDGLRHVDGGFGAAGGKLTSRRTYLLGDSCAPAAASSSTNVGILHDFAATAAVCSISLNCL